MKTKINENFYIRKLKKIFIYYLFLKKINKIHSPLRNAQIT